MQNVSTMSSQNTASTCTACESLRVSAIGGPTRRETHQVVKRLQHRRLARGAQREALLVVGRSKHRVVVKAEAAARQLLEQRGGRRLRKVASVNVKTAQR